MIWIAGAVIAPCLVIIAVVLAAAIRPSAADSIAHVLRAVAEPLSVIVPWRRRAVAQHTRASRRSDQNGVPVPSPLHRNREPGERQSTV